MADKILNAFDVWITAHGVKSRTRLRNIDNVSLDGVNRLRELILEFAIRGKLVVQDSNEQPASELLKNIEIEKEKLIEQGKIKKQNSVRKVPEAEWPFELPNGWEFVRLDQIALINPRNDADDKLEASFISMSMVSTSYTGKHQAETRLWSEIKNGFTHFADGDIGIAKITPCFENSKAIILSDLKNGIGAGTTELFIARPFGEEMSRRFILLYLKSPEYLRLGESKMTGTAGQKRLPRSFFEGHPVPFPPLAEQHRIVAKVDELMALCDALEQQETEHLKSHRLLVETLLGTLTRAADAKEFQQAWNKLYEHFDDLFATEDSIDQLKQTILQLAVMGKLVPQNPNDEPASELLKKIEREKERLVSEGKIKKQKELPLPIAKDEHLDLPNGWVLSTLGHIAQINPRNEADDSIEASFIPMSMVSTSHSGQHEFEIKKWGDIKSGFTHFADGDIGIAKITPCFENSKAILLSDLKNGIGAGTTELFIARPYGETINQRYILLYLKSPEYLRLGESQMTGTAGQKRLSRSFFEGNPLPLPPLNEQNRIVAKVDELFALCDRLKERIAEAQKVANLMAEADVGLN
jgi:type I restriction enzyme S subunit